MRVSNKKVYITADLVGEEGIEKLKTIEDNPPTTLLVAGDSKLVFGHNKTMEHEEKLLLDYLDTQPYKVLACDGIYTNYTRLYSGKIKYGGFVLYSGIYGEAYKIAARTYIVPRGNMLAVHGFRTLFFGGGFSYDKGIIPNQNYWPQELPNEQDMQIAYDIVEQRNNDIDIVISSMPPPTYDDTLNRFNEYTPAPEERELNNFFYKLQRKTGYHLWVAGHCGKDIKFSKRHIIAHDKIYEIKRKKYKQYVRANVIKDVVEVGGL